MMMTDSADETEDSEEEVDMLQNEFTIQKKRLVQLIFHYGYIGQLDFQKQLTGNYS